MIPNTQTPRPHFRIGTRWRTSTTSTTSKVPITTTEKASTRRPSTTSPTSRTTKPSRRKYLHQQSTARTVESQVVSTRSPTKVDTRYRFVSRKPYFRYTTTAKPTSTDESSTDQHIESSNQQSLEEELRKEDGTTEWAEIASALQEIQQAPVPSTAIKKRPSFNRITASAQNSRLILKNTTPSITIAKTSSFNNIPETTHQVISRFKITTPTRSEIHQTTTATPVILTTKVLKMRTRRPVQQAFMKINPSYSATNTFRPLASYDYYDSIEASILGKIPEHSKVLLHSNGVIECLDQGNFPHPISCKKFISCAKMETGKVIGWEYTCPKNLSFDPIGGMCNWSAGLGCNE